MPDLISFSGLPGVGKTTLARALAHRIDAVYLRVDSIEAALKASTLKIHPAEDAGYLAIVAVAKDNLTLGRNVIADTVNPVAITRRWWATAATDSGARLINVEIICSDQREHRRRIEDRQCDIDGLTLPDWSCVQNRQFEDWAEPRLILDTSKLSVPECIERIVEISKQAY
jgi:predicted kinase